MKKNNGFFFAIGQFFPKAEFQKSKNGLRGCRGCRDHNLEHSNDKGTRYRTKGSPIQHQ